MSQQSSIERLSQQEIQRQGMKRLWYILGPVGIVIILIIIMCMALVMVLSGGNQYGVNTYVGSAQALPASWLGLVDQAGVWLPNVVVLADMEQESGGQANSTNYNLSNGKSSNIEPIDQPDVKMISADAGLMQINSGPGWPKRPKWDKVFGPAGDPYDPQKNIIEGVKELYSDTCQHDGYLGEGLSAYNTGSGSSITGLWYADKVLENINAYESGPEADCWATGNYTGQANSFLGWHWGAKQWVQPYPNAPTWVLVTGCFAVPTNRMYTVKWAPPPDRRLPPTIYNWRGLSLPDKVTVNGQRATLNPQGAPIIPGQTVFGIQVSAPGTYTATLEWDWVSWDNGKPPHPIKHKKIITASAIKVLAPTIIRNVP